jgi:hypothetical protein
MTPVSECLQASGRNFTDSAAQIAPGNSDKGHARNLIPKHIVQSAFHLFNFTL